MTKLRSLIVAALLTLTVSSLDAGAVGTAEGAAGLNPTHQVTGVCYIFFMGRWWEVPC